MTQPSPALFNEAQQGAALGFDTGTLGEGYTLLIFPSPGRDFSNIGSLGRGVVSSLIWGTTEVKLSGVGEGSRRANAVFAEDIWTVCPYRVCGIVAGAQTVREQ